MKQIFFVLTLLLIITVACADSNSPLEAIQLPLLADSSEMARTPEQNNQPAVGPTPIVNGHEATKSSGSPIKSFTDMATVLTPSSAKTTVTPDSYPALATIDNPSPTITALPTEGPSPTVTNLPTEEPSPTIEPYPAETPISTDEVSTPTSLEINPAGGDEGILVYGYRIVNEYAHDRSSFVQGLVVDDQPGTLLEGSGLWGESSLRRVDLETGEVTQLISLPDDYFGEGITLFDDRIIQLTWKSGVGFVYDSDSFELLEVFNYPHEGWGITHDGQQLIVSDGTHIIRFWDPQTFQEKGRIQVHDEQGPVVRLNELEFVNGEILAHVWQTDTVVRIDPQTGQVTGKIDLTGLLSAEDRNGTEDVLNGIAYDHQEDRLFVTGKLWPKLFEIELVTPAEFTDQVID